MTLKTLIAIAVASAFAVPVQAAGDKAKDASASPSTSQSQSASQGASNTGNKGADAMFNSLDKNNDGKLSPQEHAAAPEHAEKKAGSGGTTSNK